MAIRTAHSHLSASGPPPWPLLPTLSPSPHSFKHKPSTLTTQTHSNFRCKVDSLQRPTVLEPTVRLTRIRGAYMMTGPHGPTSFFSHSRKAFSICALQPRKPQWGDRGGDAVAGHIFYLTKKSVQSYFAKSSTKAWIRRGMATPNAQKARFPTSAADTIS